jgi:hypothetical protein
MSLWILTYQAEFELAAFICANLRQNYLPSHSGFRFSIHAAIPSFTSSVWRVAHPLGT